MPIIPKIIIIIIIIIILLYATDFGQSRLWLY